MNAGYLVILLMGWSFGIAYNTWYLPRYYYNTAHMHRIILGVQKTPARLLLVAALITVVTISINLTTLIGTAFVILKRSIKMRSLRKVGGASRKLPLPPKPALRKIGQVLSVSHVKKVNNLVMPVKELNLSFFAILLSLTLFCNVIFTFLVSFKINRDFRNLLFVVGSDILAVVNPFAPFMVRIYTRRNLYGD